MSKELNLTEMENAIERRAELKKLIELATEEMKAKESYIKSVMENFGMDEVMVGSHKVTYKEVGRTNFDKARFCTELGEKLYKEYCTTASHLELRIYH